VEELPSVPSGNGAYGVTDRLVESEVALPDTPICLPGFQAARPDQAPAWLMSKQPLIPVRG
jgi:hypothetical protein